MTKFLYICLLAVLLPLYAFAQTTMSEVIGPREYESLLRKNHSRFDAKTLDKAVDVKSLVGQDICVRPDYSTKYGDLLPELSVTRTKYIGSILSASSTDVYTKNDRPKVVKAKKDELTVELSGEKKKISQSYFKNFMLVSDAEELIATILQEDKQRKVDEENARIAAKEKAAREKAEAEAAALKKNLQQYYDNLKLMPKAVEGPITVVVPERAYSGATAYWKFGRKYGDELNTYRDEKFVLSPHRFPILYERFKERIESGSKSLEAEYVAKLSTLQKDTFGIFSAYDFIDLRTGEVFRDKNLISGLWESVNYLNLLKEVPAKPYDGTKSLQVVLKDANVPYHEKVIESLIGEKVFLLDKLEYDEIVAIEERNSYGDCTLYLKNNGKIEYWNENVISVKWYEQLQKFVGKKIINNRELTYFGYNRFWREDLSRREYYTVEKFEVEGKRFSMLAVRNDGRKETFNAVESCGLLACSINVDQEWNKKQSTQKCLWDKNSFFSYDDVVATTPRKPANVKKQEAEDLARSKSESAKRAKLREHRIIGMSLGDFEREWPNASLVNTTISGGIVIKVYRLYDYQIVFRNGWCVSQTTY